MSVAPPSVGEAPPVHGPLDTATPGVATVIVASRRGGPDVLQAQTLPVRAPRRGRVRVRVLAIPVCLPDVQARYGSSPFPPRMPFTPGYAIVGDVDAVGGDVRRTQVGDRVAALTVTGGYTGVLEVHERALIPVPAMVDPAHAAVIVLNYLVAQQTLHRVARVRAGDAVLIIGASGGIGTALLDLGRHAGLAMVGLASAQKHAIVERFGPLAIDYRRHDLRRLLLQTEPRGFHAVLDGVGGAALDLGLDLLRSGGTVVTYANPGSLRRLARLLAKLLVVNLTPNGKTLKAYGTSTTLANRGPVRRDWATLYGLLAEGALHPVIHKVFALRDAAEANALLERGAVTGNLVLRTPYGEDEARSRAATRRVAHHRRATERTTG